MSAIVLGVDLGTTTITALAWDPAAGAIVARHTVVNDAEVTSPANKALGRSEWNPRRIVEQACLCLRSVAAALGSHGSTVSGLGITGQQHGVLVVDQRGEPLTPLVNWQDGRGNELLPGSFRSFVEEAIARVGNDAPERTGCKLATGVMGVTLFWWKVHGLIPPGGTACFIGDYLASVLSEDYAQICRAA